VDVYQSAKESTEAVMPRMAPNSLIVYDDYGFVNCGGVTRYVNELRERGHKVVHNLNGHAIVLL
jgi:O-methyltransferase